MLNTQTDVYSANRCGDFVVALNVGSSTLKFAAYRCEDEPVQVISGVVDRFGFPDSTAIWIRDGGQHVDRLPTSEANLASGIPVKRAMMTEFKSLEPSDTLQRAIDLVIATPQQDFPVVDGGIVVGILPSRELMAALQTQGQEALVGDVMRRDFLSVDANDMLDTALTRVQASECCLTAPVMQHDKMVGLLTAENVREFLLIASALGERQKQKVAIAS